MHSTINNNVGIKIVNSIDVAQSKSNKQIPPLIHSSQTPLKIKNHNDTSKDFLEELGVNSSTVQNLI